MSIGLLFVAPLVALLVVGSPAVQPIGESWEAVVGTSLGQIWGVDPVQLFVLSTGVLLAATVTVRKGHRFQMLSPMALIALGLGLASWGAVSGFGVRNGAILVYGLAWLLGVIVADWSERASARGAWRLAAVVLAGWFVGLNLVGLSFANGWVERHAPNWDAPGVQRAADWLSENARGKIAAGTPIFLNYLSFLTSGDFEARLVPVFETDQSEAPVALTAFDRQVWWAAHIPQSPVGTVELGRTYGRKFISSIIEEDLLGGVRESQADLIILTGTVPSPGPYEGVMLVPYMEEVPWAERIYTSAAEELPYWVFIYQITGNPALMDPAPLTTTYVPIPSRPDPSPNGVVVVRPSDYEKAIRLITTSGG